MIAAIRELFAAGGPVMILITIAGLLAYALLAERALWLCGAAGRRAAAVVGATRDPDARAIARRDLAGEVDRGFALAAACIAIAPLLGLLGTVGGMITTFDGILLGAGTGGVARGVGQALLTTQYGLAVAAPALIAWSALRRRGEILATRATTEAASDPALATGRSG